MGARGQASSAVSLCLFRGFCRPGLALPPRPSPSEEGEGDTTHIRREAPGRATSRMGCSSSWTEPSSPCLAQLVLATLMLPTELLLSAVHEQDRLHAGLSRVDRTSSVSDVEVAKTSLARLLETPEAQELSTSQRAHVGQFSSVGVRCIPLPLF